MDKVFDTVIKNARVVRPNTTSVDCLDIAIKDGKIARLAPDIRGTRGKQGSPRDRELKASGAHDSTECRSVTCAVGLATSSSAWKSSTSTLSSSSSLRYFLFTTMQV